MTIPLLCLALWVFVNRRESAQNDHSTKMNDLAP